MENHPSSWENQLYIAIFNNKLLTSPRRPQATAPGSLLTISKSLGRNPKTFHQFHRSYAPCKTCSKPPARLSFHKKDVVMSIDNVDDFTILFGKTNTVLFWGYRTYFVLRTRNGANNNDKHDIVDLSANKR